MMTVLVASETRDKLTLQFERLIESVSSAKIIFVYLILALLLFYGVLPAYLSFVGIEHGDYYLELAILAAVSVAGMIVGFNLPIFDRQLASGPRVHVNSTAFHWFVWTTFGVYAVVVVATAPSLPFISAIMGADTATLSEERGAFLKLRQGFSVAFAYLDTLYTGFLLPYSLALMVIERRKGWPFALVPFLAYSLISLQKALFIRVLAPLGFLGAQRQTPRPLVFMIGVGIVSVALLLINTGLERGVFRSFDPARIIEMLKAPQGPLPTAPPSEPTVRPPGQQAPNGTPLGQASPAPAKPPITSREWLSDYFDPLRPTSGTLDQIVWRIVAVPVFTAADAIRVFEIEFDRELLWGSTSTPIAALTGRPRVNYDGLVFAHQWGASDIGRANAVYFAELMVNFGLLGAFLGSVFVGMAFRWFQLSRDWAFKSLVVIFAVQLYSTGLIGTLLSNGFILLFFVGLFVDVSSPRRASALGGVRPA